jgi:predicted permease
VIAVAAIIAASVGAGVALERRLGERARSAARALLTVILYVVLPPVTFLNVARLRVDADVAGGIGLAYVALALTGGVARLVSRRALRLSRPATGSVINAAVLANTGYLGLPLTVALLGGGRLGEALAYDSLVGGPVLFVAGFGVGAAFGTRAGEGARERLRSFVVRNPPLVAALLAFAAPDALAPDFLVRASHTVILSILPFGFLALGAILMGESEDEPAGGPPAPGSAVVAGGALRLVVAPALLAGLAAPLIDLPAPYLLLAAMPCGINSLAVAHVYGLDVRISAAVIAWTTFAVVAAGLLAAAVV